MKFKCINKGCVLLDEEQSCYKVRMTAKDGVSEYFDSKTGKQIICEQCGDVLESVDNKERDYQQTAIFVNNFDSLPNDKKRAVLKKRSDEHSRTNKEFKNYKAAIDNGEIKQ